MIRTATAATAATTAMAARLAALLDVSAHPTCKAYNRPAAQAVRIIFFFPISSRFLWLLYAAHRGIEPLSLPGSNTSRSRLRPRGLHVHVRYHSHAVGGCPSFRAAAGSAKHPSFVTFVQVSHIQLGFLAANSYIWPPFLLECAANINKNSRI